MRLRNTLTVGLPVRLLALVLAAAVLRAEPADSLAEPVEDPADVGLLSLSGEGLAELARQEQWSGNGGQDDGSPILAGWDKKQGFFIRDADNNFLVRIGGRVQIRYTYKARDKRCDTVGADEVGDDDDSYMELERARLRVRGHVFTPALQYDLQLDGDSDGGGGVEVLDYLVTYKASDQIKLGAGQHKPYFLRQETTSSGSQQFVDRSLANEVFNIDRTLGVWVEGSVGENKQLFYALEMNNGFNSINRPGSEIDQIPGFVVKLDFNALGNHGYSESDFGSDEPSWVLGASFASDQNNNSSGLDFIPFKAYIVGLDTGFKQGGFSFVAEYMGRWLDFPGFDALYSHGFYTQVGFFVVPEVFELAGRVSAVWGNEGPLDGNAVEAGPGINWFFSRSHEVKFQADLIYFDTPDDMTLQTTRLIAADPADGFGSFSSSSSNLQAGEQGVMARFQLQLAF